MHVQNHGLFLENVHRVINQNAWLKPYIIMSLDLGKIEKKILKDFFFKVFNNATFGKTMGNARKHRH